MSTLTKVDLVKCAHIFRDKFTKEATLDIKTDSSWTLYAGSSIRDIDMHSPILSGMGSGHYSLPVDNVTRSYFRLIAEAEEILIAEKQLPMAGGFNFRDLGGIVVRDGRRIQWGKLFRADELTNLTEEDVEYLGSIPITSVIDFRSENEIRRSPDKLPLSAQFAYPMTISPGAVRTDKINTEAGKSCFSSQMRNMYKLYVTDPSCVRAYRIMFMIIQNNLSAPLIFHCSAGKDRTGMAAALILFALGASEETVLDDYMFSKFNIGDKYKALVQKYPRTEPIFTVKRSYMMAAIEQMKEDHGSINEFLTKVLKVDIPRLRRLYLEPR